MSAMVSGHKRPYFFDEELPSSSLSPPPRVVDASSQPHPVMFKKLRSCASPSSCFQHLKSLFPYTDPRLLERVLVESGNDLDTAIRCLHEPQSFGSADHDSVSAEDASKNVEKGNLPATGAEWVNLFVRELRNGSGIDDAKMRASKLLEVLEKSISAGAAKEGAEVFQKEIMMLKEQNDELIRETTILKRAVAIQYERQKEFEHKNQELQQLRQLVSQYQEQLKTLEVNNYALKMHLRQAHQSNPIPGRFFPDVF